MLAIIVRRSCIFHWGDEISQLLPIRSHKGLDLTVALWESPDAGDIPLTAEQMAELDRRIDEMENIPRGEVSWDKRQININYCRPVRS